MITDWTSERGIAAIEATGWPTWKQDGWRERLFRDPCGRWVYQRDMRNGQWHTFDAGIQAGVFVSILRDNAREHLRELGIDIRSEQAGKLRVWFAWIIAEGRNLLGTANAYEDYDRLQIAAILAAGEDK